MLNVPELSNSISKVLAYFIFVTFLVVLLSSAKFYVEVSKSSSVLLIILFPDRIFSGSTAKNHV